MATLTITTKDVGGNAVGNTNVLVEPADGTQFPYQDSVSITRGILEDSYAFTNQNDESLTLDNNNSIVAQAFQTSANAGYLTRARFYMRRVGNPGGLCNAKLWAHSGTYGTSSIGTGAALATSGAAFVAFSVMATYVLWDFTFNGTYLLSDSTYYVIGIEYSGGTATDYLMIGADNSTPSHGGNACYYSTAWNADSTRDLCFEVMSDGGLAYTSHTAHGLSTGDKVSVRGCDELPTLNGVEEITVVDANNYTFPTPAKSWGMNIMDYGDAAGQHLPLDNTYTRYAVEFYSGSRFKKTYLNRVTTQAQTIGSPTGNVDCKLYSSVSGSPGSVLATALPIQNAGNMGFAGNPNYWFFVDGYELQEDTYYFLSIEYTGGDASNYVRLQAEFPYVTDYNVKRYSGSWSDSITYFYITAAVRYTDSDTGGNATLALVNGLSNATTGVISASRTYTSDQDVVGWARKASASPYYIEAPILGTVDTVDGMNAVARLVEDV